MSNVNVNVVELPGSNGRYFVELNTLKVYSVVKPGRIGQPTELEPNAYGTYYLTFTQGAPVVKVDRPYLMKVAAAAKNAIATQGGIDKVREARVNSLKDVVQTSRLASEAEHQKAIGKPEEIFYVVNSANGVFLQNDYAMGEQTCKHSREEAVKTANNAVLGGIQLIEIVQLVSVAQRSKDVVYTTDFSDIK